MASNIQPLRRVPTGVPGLDLVLGGGLLAGGVYIVMGAPGAGKTILANQIAFHHAGEGGRVLFVTLLAESHDRMLAHLRPMRFVDEAAIGSRVVYMSGYRVLDDVGLAGLLELLRRAIREHAVTMLVLDGLVTAEAIAESELDFKRFIHELHAYVTLVGCTSLLLTNQGEERRPRPEHTMVDGLLQLRQELVGAFTVRQLAITKFRGSAHLEGRHTFAIRDDGIVVHPRIEAWLPRESRAQGASSERVSMESPALDAALGGGLVRGSTTLLIGAPGTGKTALGLQFLAAGARRGESALHFGFDEAPARLRAKARSIGLAVDAHVDGGPLALVWHQPLEHSLDELGGALVGEVRRRGARRVVVDGIGGFVHAASQDRLGRFLVALTNGLRAMEVTAIFIDEAASSNGIPTSTTLRPGGVSAIAENLVCLRSEEHDGRVRRILTVVKTRDSASDPAKHELRVTAAGVAIEPLAAPA